MHIRDLPQYECAIIFRVRLHDEDALCCAVVDLVTQDSGDEAYREETRRLVAPDPATAMMHILMRSHEFGLIGGTTRVGRTRVIVTALNAESGAAGSPRSTAELRWNRE